MDVRCVLCGKSVPRNETYRRVSGWEKKAVAASRKAGSDVVLRESHDEYGCFECIARLRAGLNVAQESLI